MPIRLSGLASGLDTEAIVGALVSSYSYKKDKYVKAQTKLSWKQDAWKELNSKVYSLYTEVGNMRYSSSYTYKKTSVSDNTKAKATASGTAINGTQSLEIKQLAKTAYITGGKLADNITSESSLSELGISTGSATGNAKIQVRTGTSSKTIEIDSTMNIRQFVSKLNEAGVQANFDEKNHRFFISSSQSGLAGDFSISANNSLGLTSLMKLGLLTDSELADIQSTVNTDESNASGFKTSDMVKKQLSFTANNAVLIADEAGMLKTLEDIKTNIAEARAAKEAGTATLEQDDWVRFADALESKYAKTFGVATTTGEGDEAVTTYSIDWENISEDQLKEFAKQMYTDAEYTEEAQDATRKEITSAINAIRDKYMNLAKVKAEKYDTDAEKEAAIAQAQSELDATLSDRVNKKWADYIQGTFGAHNSETDDGYDNFWIQSDNLELSESVFYRVDLSSKVALGQEEIKASSTATKINGQDAVIKLNGVEFTSDSNSITVNGLTIEALSETAEGAPISITVSNDIDGIYDKIKDFLTSYNNLMNEMQKLYNADSAKDYEPLTDDEKAEMNEDQIEKWEQKIKDSLLRRDSSLSSIISTMTMAMMKTYEVNGKKVSWSTYGIHTLGTLNSEKNEGYAYHINGDSEDSKTSGEKDKLRVALAEDPDAVIDFLKQVTTGLYKDIDAKMKSTSVKSIYTVYNDKEMASEYSDYSKLIKTWQDRVTEMEDSYYKKFSQMEAALAKLQSNSSSITQMLGG